MLKSILICWVCLTAIHTPFALGASSSSLQGQDLLSSRTIELNEKPTRPTVVVFVSARCPCSASHEKLIKDLAESKKEFDFIAVHSNPDEPKEEALRHFKSANMGIPVLHDEDGQWVDHFQALKTPHAFVVSREGKVIYSGGVTDSSQASSAEKHYLKEALDEFQTSGKIKESRRRALGCVIQRRKS